MPLPPLSSSVLLQTLNIPLSQSVAANDALRGTLAPLAQQLPQSLGLAEEHHAPLAEFLGGSEPSQGLLQELHSKSADLQALIAGQSSSVLVVPSASVPETAEVERSSLFPVRVGPVRNPGLKMPMPDGGFGLVLADFDKTLFGGDSHMRLVSLGLRTRFDELRKLDNPGGRLLETLKMTYRYKTHTLDPSSAKDAVATLLDAIPVLQVARDWADAGARAGLKRGVLRLVHERAREIVRAEVEELIKEGKMAEPLSDADVEEEARTRIFTVSSQFANVLRMLTDVGPDHENLLGFNVENVLGSTGTFTEAGNFVAGDDFRYCFDENKPKMAEEEFERRGIEFNSATLNAFTDDVWYDRFLLAMAHKPENRYIIDPDSRDSDYARHEGTQVVNDQWDHAYQGKWTWVAGIKGRPKTKKLEVIQDQRFYPDTRSVVSTGDSWNRAIWGAAEMMPLAIAEGIQHGLYGDGVHPASVAVALGAGMLYGPLNRSVKSDVIVGAVLAGGMAAVHTGSLTGSPLVALAGGAALALGQGLLRNLVHKGSAAELGPKGFRAQTRFMSFLARTGVTGGLFAVMRALGLG